MLKNKHINDFGDVQIFQSFYVYLSKGFKFKLGVTKKRPITISFLEFFKSTSNKLRDDVCGSYQKYVLLNGLKCLGIVD